MLVGVWGLFGDKRIFVKNKKPLCVLKLTDTYLFQLPQTMRFC